MSARPSPAGGNRIEGREALVAAPNGAARALALDMIEGALASVDPGASTVRALREASAEGLALDGAVILALGKAASAMAEAAAAHLGSERGLVITPDRRPIAGLDVRVGEHPVSGARAIDAGQALLRLAALLPRGAPVVCLVSGGGSAMADVPVEGITPSDLAAAQRALLGSGAPIDVVNLVRRRMSRLKGGGLASALAHTEVVTIVLSDTPGHPLSTIASGPTIAPDGAEPAVDVERALVTYGLDESLPAAALAAVRRGRDAEPAPRSPVFVAADNATARTAAADVARARGRDVLEWETPISGEAREVGEALYARARSSGRAVIVAGGETTVTLRGGGRGGRNHEVCLGALGAFEGGLVVAFGTDGVDGSSGAAGALLDANVALAAEAQGLDWRACLEDNDSARFFERTGAQLITGPTGTNVADLWMYLA